MITVRKAGERGHFNHGWLDTYHTFSFADYHDPTHMGFRTLRVINEDRVAPGKGFGTHPHRDMEIITYVLKGALEHKDSMGNGSVIRPGEVQKMSAGSGVTHSEYNPSQKEPVHLLQIWIFPDKKGIKPAYEQKTFPETERQNTLRLIAAREGKEGAVTLQQDAKVYSTILDPGREVSYTIAPGRHVWLQVARGTIQLNDVSLGSGDGAALSEEVSFRVEAKEKAELLLFDLA